MRQGREVWELFTRIGTVGYLIMHNVGTNPPPMHYENYARQAMSHNCDIGDSVTHWRRSFNEISTYLHHPLSYWRNMYLYKTVLLLKCLCISKRHETPEVAEVNQVMRKPCCAWCKPFRGVCKASRQSWGPFDKEKRVENTQNQPMYFTLWSPAPFGQ